jgi:hypothetical protein
MILDQFDQSVFSASGRAEDLVREYYGKKLSQNNARKYMSGVRMHLKAKQRMPEPDGKSGFSEVVTKYDGTKTIKRMMVLSESDANDPIRVIQLNGLDPLKWELVKYGIRRTDWDVTMKMKEYSQVKGEGASSTSWKEKETNHLFSIDLVVKPIQEVLSTDYIVQVFEELEKPKIDIIKHKPGTSMFEFPIMDLHLGKLAWGEETGDDYDLKIAEQVYKDMVEDILGKAQRLGYDFEEVVFPVGQDFFHIDNSDSATTRGTRVDTDSRWEKMYRVGVRLLIWTIEQLRQLAPVYIMYVPGNHDTILSYCAVYTLYAYYKNCKDVTINIEASPRKYYRYGVNLIGFSHGKEGKRIEHLMQQEVPQDWGQTIFREWHLGDLHHEEAKEIGGVKIRRISTITATDAWHAEKGYRSIRMAQAFVWDKEKGRQFVIDSNVDY